MTSWRSRWIAAIGAGLAASSIAAMAQGGIPPGLDRCKPQGNDRDCVIEVHHPARHGAGCLSVAPAQDTVEFGRADTHRPRFIFWRLVAAPGFTFTPDGIAIQGNDGEFDLAMVMDRGLTYRWRNRHSRAGDYKYAINIAGPGGVRCTLDPFIRNQ